MSPVPSNLLLILALSAVAVSARADETNIFSSPTDGPKGKTDSSTGNSQRQLDAGNYNAPKYFFNNHSPSLPMPRPVFLGNLDAAAQDALNRSRNWALLTPEQILGMQTAEDIFGLKKPDSNKNLSLEEQFLLRESQPVSGAVTNGRIGAISWQDSSNPFQNKNNGNAKDDQPLFSGGAFYQPDDQPEKDSARYFRQFLKATGGGSGLGKKDSKQAANWSSAFAQPAPPRQTPAQLADMESFRAMLEPVSPPDKTATDKNPAVRTSFSTTPAMRDADSSGSLFQPLPTFNSAGQSVGLLKDDITRPVGIKPLPGITGPEKITSDTRPAWQAQLPPWLLDGPPGHPASRNF
jgi:hypothetical protein